MERLELTAIPEPLHASIQAMGTALNVNLGKQLQGITVVGSCLTPDYQPGHSDINTVLMVDRIDRSVLEAVTKAVRPLARKHHLAVPLLMTATYMERSRDVFGIEWLDFQLTHQTVLGDDPFADLTFAKTDVRLQCEREFKADLIRLRQGAITAAGSNRLLREVVMAALKSLAPKLRAVLWLHDVRREAGKKATFQQAAQTLGLSLDALLPAAHWRQQKARPQGAELYETYDRLYDLIDQLAVHVDGLEVS